MKWEELWSLPRGAPDQPFLSNEALRDSALHEPGLQPITLQQLDNALAKFPRDTATGIDNWHIPDWRRLPDHLRMELAGLLMRIEHECVVPSQLFPSRMTLLPKPKRDFAPVPS